MKKTYRRETTAFKKKSKKAKAAVRKGKRESEVLDLWRQRLEEEGLQDKVEAHRMSQFRGGDKRPDINIHAAGNLYDQFFHDETKHDENISLRAAFMQAVEDCRAGADPCACVKRFREPRIGVVWYDDLVKYRLAWLKQQTVREE